MLKDRHTHRRPEFEQISGDSEGQGAWRTEIREAAKSRTWTRLSD